MGKVDLGLDLEMEGVRNEPRVPKMPTAGDYFRVILTFTGSIDPIEAAGFLPGIVVNDMATGLIAKNKLDAIKALPQVVRIDKDHMLKYQDLSRAEVKADVVQTTPHQSVMGYDGTGVIVGIIDGSFDYRHKAFRKGADGTGETRILWLWDQGATGWQPGLNYGTKYDAADINASLQAFELPADLGGRIPYRNPAFHGSHVAAIAAGRGSPDGNGNADYIGMAPNADLILVDISQDEMGGSLAEGIAFIAQKAQESGKRAVINISLGYTGFACDGYSPVDRLMNGLMGQYPDIVIVSSAGNSGHFGFHTEGEVTAQQPFVMPLEIHDAHVIVDIWYGASESFLLTVTPPAGSLQTFAPTFETQGPGPQRLIHKWTDGNKLTFASEIHPYNDKRRTAVVFEAGDRATIAPGQWELKLHGTPSLLGKVHAWINFDVSQHSDHPPRFVNATAATTLESPGCAERVISVGAYFSRVTPKLSESGHALGSLAFFSSRGPLLNLGSTPAGRVKPDICAPGVVVFSANNVFGQAPDDPVVDTYLLYTGTSMAAPHVAGVIALLLQKEKTLPQDQVFLRLKKGARKDAFTGNVPNTDWGHGKLDAWATLYPPPPPGGGGGGGGSIVADHYQEPLRELRGRMTRSRAGREYVSFFERHRDEIIHLIRHHRRVAVAWLRCGAPAAHVLLTHLLTPEEPLPAKVHGVSLSERLGRFLRALGRYGGSDLRAAASRLHDPIAADGLSWSRIVARFEADA